MQGLTASTEQHEPVNQNTEILYKCACLGRANICQLVRRQTCKIYTLIIKSTRIKPGPSSQTSMLAGDTYVYLLRISTRLQAMLLIYMLTDAGREHYDGEDQGQAFSLSQNIRLMRANAHTGGADAACLHAEQQIWCVCRILCEEVGEECR